MARPTYRADRQGTQDLINSPGVSRLALAGADAGRAWAAVAAPRVTGEYARGLEVRPSRTRLRGRERAAAVFIATAPHSRAVERRHRVLARTVDVIENAR